MKIARLACGMSAFVVLLAACARSPEAGAPAASAAGATPASAPAEPEAEPAPASPAPQGLAEDGAPSKTKAPALDDELATLESAERALNQAKSDLDRLALAQPSPLVGRSAAADSATEKKDAKRAQAPAAAPAAAGAPNVCENACRAFSSLTRAANAVCRLDSSTGTTHCTRAKRLVAEAEPRVQSCACPPSAE